MKRIFYLLQFCLLATLFSDCSEDETSDYVTLLLRISHKVDGQPLQPQQVKYKNALNQSFSVVRLNYYLSNIKLRNDETGDYYHEVNSYHLVEALKNVENTEIIIKNVPKKKFSKLEISIGVDNAANHSVDRVGDLDPSNFMAWGWKTGYKFFEISGGFVTDSSSGNYVFHVGEDPTFKTITFSFKDLLGTNLDILKDGQVLMEANINGVFGAPGPVNFNVLNLSESAASGGVQLAENYATGFFKMVGAQ